WYSLIARSMFSPSVALGPDRVSTEPILIVWADACTANSSAPAARVAVLMTCFTLPSSQEIRLILYQPGERGTDFLIDLYPHLLDKLPVLVVVAADQGGELRGRADVGFQPSGGVKLLAGVGFGEQLVDLAVKAREHRCRCSRRGEQAQPDRHLVAGVELRDGRQVGEHIRALQ